MQEKSFILLIDKPAGISSHACLQRAKRLLGIKKIGHTGSLDPLASGMLPMCVNHATKCADLMLTSDKMYFVTAQLGATTTTGDAEGDILTQQPVPTYPHEKILTTLESFLGASTQIPPMYSALKHQGQPLYRLARKGLQVDRQPRCIQIYELRLRNYDPQSQTLSLSVRCSKGTYIRTLVEDIGQKLGCGAFVATLRREGVGKFTADRMICLENLEVYLQTHPVSEQAPFVVALSEVFQSYPVIELTETELAEIRFGRLCVLGASEGIYALHVQKQCIGILRTHNKKQKIVLYESVCS